MTIEPNAKKIQRRVARYRMRMAGKDEAFRVANDQRAAAVRNGLQTAGVTDMTAAAIGWLEAQAALLATIDALRPVIGPVPVQVVEAIDNMLATGLAILDEEDRKTPKLIVPGEEP